MENDPNIQILIASLKADSLERIEFMRFLDDPENMEGRLDVYGGDDMYMTMHEKSGVTLIHRGFPS